MSKKYILGAKYFIKDLITNEIIQAQITSLNDVELTYIDLNQDNGDFETETYRSLNKIEIVDTIEEEFAQKLNNQSLFSIQNHLIRAIIGRNDLIRVFENDFKDINKDENTVLISITDPGTQLLPNDLLNSFKEQLSIQFHDVTSSDYGIPPITKEQGKEIKEFILKNKNNNFVIHCEAGMSRSAGVGHAVWMLVEKEGDRLFFQTSPNPIKEHHRYKPNWLVFDMIVED